MSFLSLMEANLPPGFRFHPRDEELVSEYLAKKVAGVYARNSTAFPTIVELDLNKIEPWDLPELACVGGKEWYFFSLRDRKYATGPRTNRATISGYWKATGKDRQVMDIHKGFLVGMRKTLVFHQGRAPKGKKTDWVMHEFRLEGPHVTKIPSQEDWVLCRVFFRDRGASSGIKAGHESSYDEEDDGKCPSLPPLTDAFHPLDGFEQVPCFSSHAFSHSQAQSEASLQQHLHSQAAVNLAAAPGGLPAGAGAPLGLGIDALNPAPGTAGCEQLIRAVLDHLGSGMLLEAASSFPECASADADADADADSFFFSGVMELPFPWSSECFL